jgi:hypothetical protein
MDENCVKPNGENSFLHSFLFFSLSHSLEQKRKQKQPFFIKICFKDVNSDNPIARGFFLRWREVARPSTVGVATEWPNAIRSNYRHCVEFVPGQFVPGQFVPGQFIPRQFVNGQFVPGQFVNGQFVPRQFTPWQFVNRQFITGQCIPTS